MSTPNPGLHQRAGRLPAQRLPASAVCLVVVGLWRQHQAAVQHRDNVDHPISLYAASKKANELMAHSYAHLFRLPATGLRFFTVYGPWGRPDMAMWIFAKAIMEGQPIRLFNHGKMRRDFTYVDDVVESVVRLIDKPAAADPAWSGDKPDPSRSSAPWRVYNIGNNQPVECLMWSNCSRRRSAARRRAKWCRCSPATCRRPMPTSTT